MPHQTTTDDFQSTKVLDAGPDAVFTALTDLDALTGWWTPAGGGTAEGETLYFLMGDQEVVMRVAESRTAARVRWDVLACEPAEDWVGTSICFELAPRGNGTELRFEHRGLTPDLACYEQCNAGWTHFLSSLVDYVDLGAGSPNAPGDPEKLAEWRAGRTVS